VILLEVGRFHVAITTTWGLRFIRGYFFTAIHVGALLFGWVNRHPQPPA
jgi:hypothetical protein